MDHLPIFSECMAFYGEDGEVIRTVYHPMNILLQKKFGYFMPI